MPVPTPKKFVYTPGRPPGVGAPARGAAGGGQPPMRPHFPPPANLTASRIGQAKTANRQAAPLPYRPQVAPKAAPAVYRPQAVQRVQAKNAVVPGKAAMPGARPPIGPPAYRPQPIHAAPPPVYRPAPVRMAQPFPAGKQRNAPTVQRWVNLANSDLSANGRYIVEKTNPTVLYSTKDAAAPSPLGLYARGKDKGYWGHSGFSPVKLNSWTPNVRFLSRAEAQGEPLSKPGFYEYKTKGMLGGSTETYSIEGLQSEVRNPLSGLDGPPTFGVLGKNDCNIFASTLQNLMYRERGALYEMEGRKATRTVEVESPSTNATDLDVQVGDRMKHVFQGSDCRYHAATVVAKDGVSAVTLEANVAYDRARPLFYIHKGLAGFAAEGIHDKLGDKVDVIPVGSLTYQEAEDEWETRSSRFENFSNINPVFWGFENETYSYRGRLLGDLGVTWTTEKTRRDKLAESKAPEFHQIWQNRRQPGYDRFPQIEY